MEFSQHVCTIVVIAVISTSLIQGILVMEVLVNPTNISVSYNDIATFNCSCSNANDMFWLLNDSYHEQLSIESEQKTNTPNDEGNSTLTGSLTITITEFATEMNNTEVVCKCSSLFVSPFVVLSKPATLMLQGTLESPTDVNAKFSKDMILLSWEQPFTLHGVVILGYNVVVVTIIDSKTYMGTQYLNATQEELVIYPYDQSSCTHFDICVNAITAAGLGEKACVNIKRENGVPRKLTTKEVATYVVESDPIKNTSKILHKFRQDSCLGDRADNAMVESIDYDGKKFSPSIDDTVFKKKSNGNITLEVLMHFLSNVTATSTIILVNNQGSVPSEHIPVYFPLYEKESVTYAMPTLPSPPKTGPSSARRLYTYNTINTVFAIISVTVYVFVIV